jgi:protein O-mannosyl-transferase
MKFPHRLELTVCLFLIVIIFIVFFQLSSYDFVNFDDDLYITKNLRVQAGLTAKNVVWALSSTDLANWHPLTWLSHMLVVQLFGMNPGFHHLTNLFFHIANALLIFLIFNKVTGAPWRSFCLALLFALHPLNVEPVAWVSERKGVLSTFFWMLTMWSYIRYVERPVLDRYLLVFLFFILGLMAKPMIVTLPFVLLLIDFWPLKRFKLLTSGSIFNFHAGKKTPNAEGMIQTGNTSGYDSYSTSQLSLRPVFEKTPLFILSVVSCAVTYFVQNSAGAVRSLEVIPLKSRIANALVSYVTYIGKTVYPQSLAVFYPYPVIIPWWKVIGACSILISVSYLAWKSFSKYPYILVGWLWYLGTLLPVIGLVQVGSQAMADRYAYVPVIGLFIIIVWGVTDLIESWNYHRIMISLVATGVMVILSIMTIIQVGCWKNSYKLFNHALETTSNNAPAHNNFGNALVEQNKDEEAGRHYAEALRINPYYAEAHYNLGNFLGIQGKYDEAINHYYAALKTNPRFKKAHYNLGNVLAKVGRVAEAMRHFTETIRIDPGYAEAYNNLGVVLSKVGKLKEATSCFRRAIRINPDYKDAQQNLKTTLVALEKCK